MFGFWTILYTNNQYGICYMVFAICFKILLYLIIFFISIILGLFFLVFVISFFDMFYLSQHFFMLLRSCEIWIDLVIMFSTHIHTSSRISTVF